MDTSTTFGSLLMGSSVQPIYLVAVAIVSALVGMFSHWAKKQFRDKIDVNWFSYFFIQNRKATFVTVGGVLAGLFTAFAPIDYTTITAYQVIVQAFAVGFASDSAFNNIENIVEVKQTESSIIKDNASVNPNTIDEIKS